jgi:hypothetical protein
VKQQQQQQQLEELLRTHGEHHKLLELASTLPCRKG